MAIFTPRGLKIRLGIDHCFALIARLYPKVDAFKVLKTTEGLESIPGFVAFATGLICFVMQLEPLQIGKYTFAASVAGFLITLTGFYVIPGLPALGTLYSYVSGFGILLIAVVVAGFVLVGWQGVAAFFIAKFVAFFTKFGIGLLYTNTIFKEVGIPLTMSEINFFNAYRLHAAKLGKSTDISVTDEELEEENWKEVFEDLAMKWPQVVSRFTIG